MNSYSVVKLGNPKLRLICEPFDNNMFGSIELKNIAELLKKAFLELKGIGLAAPQIGISKRMIIFGMDTHHIYKNATPIPMTTLINPTFEPLSSIVEEEYEGCLSVGELRAKVPRYKHIKYSGYDIDGNFIKREAHDLHARLIQHEIDHLDGIVFLDRVKNTSSLGFLNELLDAGILNNQSLD